MSYIEMPFYLMQEILFFFVCMFKGILSWLFVVLVFLQEFGLIDRKELAPLQELIDSIIPY